MIMQNEYKIYEEKKTIDIALQKTKDYHIFKLRDSNRDISELHVKKLIDAISLENNLHLHPIIVNINWEVIDGQHRLLAAKKLGLFIYFIKDDNVSNNHIVTSNVNQNKFKNIDYVKYYCKEEKNINYIMFDMMMKKTGLSPKALQSLMHGHHGNSTLIKLTNGEYIFENSERVHTLINFYLRVRDLMKKQKIQPERMVSNYVFTHALNYMMQTPDFEEDLFIKKIQAHWYMLKPQLGVRGWYKLFLMMYNHGQKINKIESIFDD
jgi:hypothetical protein